MLSWVNVVRDDGSGAGNDVFVDGQFADPAGFVGEPFRTDTGQHTFQTLGPDNFPDWEKLQTIDKPSGNGKQNPVPVVLQRVLPKTGP